MGSTRVRLAIGLGLLLVVGWLVIVLSEREKRLAGSNAQVAVSGNDVVIRGGEQNCQDEGIPKDAALVTVFTGVPRGTAGPLDIVIKEANRTVTRGRFTDVKDGLPATTVLSPSVTDEVLAAELCLKNRGRATIRVAGDRTPLRFSGANPYGFLYEDEPRVDFLRSGEESWWSIAGVVAERFGHVKTSFFGSWTMWVVLALVAATWIGALLLVLRKKPVRS